MVNRKGHDSGASVQGGQRGPQQQQNTSKNIVAYMDSNSKYINLPKLLKVGRNKVQMKRTYAVEQAIDRFNQDEEQHPPTDVVLHVGTNNLDKQQPNEVIRLIEEFRHCVALKYPKARLHISEILPRKSANGHQAAGELNVLLQTSFTGVSNVNLFQHRSIRRDQLRDEKHLSFRWEEGEQQCMSGTMWLACDIFEAVMGHKPEQRFLLGCRYRHIDLYPY